MISYLGKYSIVLDLTGSNGIEVFLQWLYPAQKGVVLLNNGHVLLTYPGH